MPSRPPHHLSEPVRAFAFSLPEAWEAAVPEKLPLSKQQRMFR